MEISRQRKVSSYDATYIQAAEAGEAALVTGGEI
jgi:predicted nucleic acid-binding protein